MTIQPRVPFDSKLQSEAYRGLLPEDLIEILTMNARFQSPHYDRRRLSQCYETCRAWDDFSSEELSRFCGDARRRSARNREGHSHGVLRPPNLVGFAAWTSS
jgi:hypothetical protein